MRLETREILKLRFAFKHGEKICIIERGGIVTMKALRKPCSIVAAVSLVMVLVFMTVASGFNSAWGDVTITDVHYPNSEGGMLHGQLFVPKGASSSNPAPAILNMHGGSDYLQTVSNYSIELARRGYVVLTVDAYGSGESDFVSTAAASNPGGPGDAENNTALKMDGGVSLGLEQLMGYKFVDQSRIGMTGHSMGGTYVANAALEYADHIKAIMPWGSGSFVDKMKTSDPNDFTFNVGYINAKSDEMVAFVTKEDPEELLKNDLLKAFFRTDEDLVAGKVYGDFSNGTGRIIYTPDTTHIGNIINRGSIGSMMDFFSHAMPSGTALASTDQVWMYKELFCVLATVALVTFIISIAFVLLNSAAFAPVVNQNTPTAVSVNKWGKLAGLLICIAVPALTLHKAGIRLATLKPNGIFPMNWANSLAGLAVVNGLVLLALFLVWHFAYAKKCGSTLSAYGFTDDSKRVSWRQILYSALLAITLIFITYLVVNCCYALFKIDFRFWQFGIMPITLKRFKYLLGYLLCYLFAFGITNTVSIAFADIGSGTGTGKWSTIKQYLLGWLIGAGGYTIIMIIYYAILKATHTPPFLSHPNSLVFSMKTTCLVPTFTILSAINTALYRKTKNIYIGWFTAAIFAAMILITTNAFAV
jgi:dienelactone hydrolase